MGSVFRLGFPGGLGVLRPAAAHSSAALSPRPPLPQAGEGENSSRSGGLDVSSRGQGAPRSPARPASRAERIQPRPLLSPGAAAARPPSRARPNHGRATRHNSQRDKPVHEGGLRVFVAAVSTARAAPRPLHHCPLPRPTIEAASVRSFGSARLGVRAGTVRLGLRMTAAAKSWRRILFPGNNFHRELRSRPTGMRRTTGQAHHSSTDVLRTSVLTYSRDSWQEI